MNQSPPCFTEIDRNKIARLCRDLERRNAQWHIHALHPGCCYNPNPADYCFVVEDTDAKKAWRCFSNKLFTDECRELVQLLHGTSILDDKARDPDFTPPKFLQSVRECVSKGEKWHHHIMKPDCVFRVLSDEF